MNSGPNYFGIVLVIFEEGIYCFVECYLRSIQRRMREHEREVVVKQQFRDFRPHESDQRKFTQYLNDFNF